jgi:hypothetical protein
MNNSPSVDDSIEVTGQRNSAVVRLAWYAGSCVVSGVVRPVARVAISAGLAYAGFYPAALAVWFLL